MLRLNRVMPDELSMPHIQRAAEVLASSKRLLVLAGAGLSADAGVSTFRGHGGIWGNVDPEELASLQGFEKNPDRVWEWYRQRRMEIAMVEPHEGQRSLAMLQKYAAKSTSVLVATTNEDDLLERAGVEEVIHLHGSLFNTACSAHCGWSICDDGDNSWSLRDCPRCGQPVRPGSVWFGEALPESAFARLEAFDADACLLIGSSSLVQPIAAIPPEMILAHLPVVEVNIEETPFSDSATFHLHGRASHILPALVDHITSSVVREQGTAVFRKRTVVGDHE